MKYQRPHKLKYGKWGLIFILPFFIAYGIFNLYPLIMTFYNSFFSKYEDLFDTVVQFVGFDNYATLFAVTGPVNQLFGTAFNFLEDEWSIRLLIAFINFIMWTGNTTILLMAGIMGIDPALYEASSIDGASAGQQFKKITLPMLKPIMLYVMVTSMIGGLQMFDIPNLLVKNGGPNEIAKTVVMDISNGISGSADVGFAATESVVLFFVAGIIGIFLFKLMESDDDKEARANKKAQKKALKNAKKGA